MKIFREAGIKKIQLSKLDWFRIGVKAKWQKLAEVIEIDGKYYEDRNGDLVEIPKPKKNIVVPIDDFTYRFVEGDIYKDHAGQYRVDSINNENLNVTYIDGHFPGKSKIYTALSRAQILHNMRKEQDALDRMQTINFGGPNEWLFLGYLAKHGTIRAQVPLSKKTWFEEIYKRLTGDDAQQYIGTESYHIAKDESKYALELRIIFPTPPQEYMSRMFFKNVNLIHRNDRSEINDNNFVKNLFKLGFKLGNNSNNVTNIRGRMNEDKVHDFDVGWRL